MSLKERENGILEYLRQNGEADVEALCNALYVSAPTMRRDLAALQAAGKIIRTHGGAAWRQDPWSNIPFSYREHENSDAKATMAKKCLSLIHDNDTLMLDGSSSAFALLREIGSKRSVVVITNSAKAPLFLAETGMKVFVTGGELQSSTYAYVGSHAEEFLRGFNADICFFSVRTLTEDGRLTDNAVLENAIRKIMLRNAKKSVLLLDSEKIGAPCINTLCLLSDIDYVVSERDISGLFPAYREKFI